MLKNVIHHFLNCLAFLCIISCNAADSRGNAIILKNQTLEIKTYNEPRYPFMIIAHRGVSALFPENTLIAIEEAVNLQSDLVEIDVVFTKDLVPIVFHDDTLGRTVKGSGYVKDFTFEELKDLDAGIWFSNDFKGIRIPTLKEALLVSKNRISVLIELKHQEKHPYSIKRRVEEIISVVQDTGKKGYVAIFSVNPNFIAELNFLNGDIPRGIVSSNYYFPEIIPQNIKNEFYIDFIVLSHDKLNSNLCYETNASSLMMLSHTFNSIELVNQFSNCGLHGYITDKPSIFQ